MNWRFWRRNPNPLDVDELRGVETAVRGGDLGTAASEVGKARTRLGDRPSVRFLEALLYHEGSGAEPADLRQHLEPAVTPSFPEARLLAARLKAAEGDLASAMEALRELKRTRLSGPLAAQLEENLSAVTKLVGSEGTRRVQEQAEAVAETLARKDIVVRWRISDLARLDSLLDDEPELAREDRERWTSLTGEIVRRARSASWRLAPRAEDRAIVTASGAGWSVGRAVRDRLAKGAPLYAAAHRALGSPFRPVPGFPQLSVYIEPRVHPTVAIDHVARALVEAGASGVGVLRQRPTPDGPLVLPLSFLDKSGVIHAAYIETEPWNDERTTALKRWLWRLRSSSARDAEVLLLAAEEPSEDVLELVRQRIENLQHGPFTANARIGARSATPRSLDEPKLRWLDDKAEVMESLVRAALGTERPSDLELTRKIQETLLQSYRIPFAQMSPKQWSALYGYGALYGRILARSMAAKWSALFDETQPSQWEMVLPDGRRVWPVGVVLKLAQLGADEGDLVGHYLELRAAERDNSRPPTP